MENVNKVLCVVVTPGLFLSPAMNAKEIPVGAEVELTERQLNAYSGKVRRKDSTEGKTAATLSSDLLASLEGRIAELEGEVKAHVSEIKNLRGDKIKLEEDNVKLNADLAAAREIIAGLEAEG